MRTDKVILSVYCYRVAVKVNEKYKGFTHHDNRLGEYCGTIIWYPSVNYHNFEGCDFFVYNNKQKKSGEVINSLKADYIFTKDQYKNNAIYLKYPYNLLHGVTPGTGISEIPGMVQIN